MFMSLQKLKKTQRAYYKTIVSVECPILGATVFFRNKGFFHLINESNSTHYKTIPRDPNEQYLKLKCLVHVEAVIKNATKIHETRIVKRKDDKGSWKKTTQYALVHQVSKTEKIRVIIEKVGQGAAIEHQFLSIMPHGKKNHGTKKHP